MPKPDYGGAGEGGVSGAMTGFQVSGGNPYVTAGAGAAGAALGLFGGKKKAKKRSRYDKKQQALYADEHAALYGEGPMADLYNFDAEGANAVFDKEYANPAYRKFEEDLVPKTTGAFRSEGLQNSSYVGDAVTKMARDIQEGLDAQRTKYLYGEQSDARQAKRDAVKDIQGRTTFDREKPDASNLDRILASIKPEDVQMLKDHYSKGGA